MPLAEEIEVFITPNATIETTVNREVLRRLLQANGIQKVVPCHYPHFKDVITSSEICYHIFERKNQFNTALFEKELTELEKLTFHYFEGKEKERSRRLVDSNNESGRQTEGFIWKN